MSVAGDAAVLLGRSWREALRSPLFAFAFPILFPLFMIVLTSQMFRELVHLPGFPISPYAAYEAPAVLLLTAMMGAGHSATGLVIDAQTGFLDRLRLFPIRPVSVLLGRLLFDAVRVLPAGAVVLGASVLLGARVDSGVPGALALLALLAVWALSYNGIFYVVGLRTRNPQAPLAVVPLFMPLMFLSPAFMPYGLLPRWLQVASDWNPYSYMVQGARFFMTGDVGWGAVLQAVALAEVVMVLTLAWAASAFRKLVETD